MKRFWIFVLSNLDTLIAIGICIVVAILGILGRGQSVMISAIAGILGLMAYGLIRDRVAREELLRQIQQLNNPPSVADILKNRNSYSPLSETISSAQFICFMGPSLITIFSQWTGYLYYTKLIEHGASIQALILDPSSSALESTSRCMNENVETLRQEIEGTILRVRSICQESDAEFKGSFELRLMPVHPNYSIVLIDPDKPGKMFIEFIGYHSRLHTRPHIELTRQHDREWFEYFLGQYEELWRSSPVHSKIEQGTNSPKDA